MRKSISRQVRFLSAVALSLVLFLTCSLPVYAITNTRGNAIYGNATDNRCFYPRTIQLSNGEILCAFSRNYDDNGNVVPRSHYIYKSSDNGFTWTFLSEIDVADFGYSTNTQNGGIAIIQLPTQMGEYPAGTLLFASTDSSATSEDVIHLFRSTDNGQSWQEHSNVALRGQNDPSVKSNNVWEPELLVSMDGSKLICFYSDERQENYDQCISYEVSTDGGITWGNYTVVVGEETYSTGSRAGMPRIAKLKNNQYMMVYEVIGGNPSGGIHYRVSSDGLNWGEPDNIGNLIATDISVAKQCPSIGFVDDGTTYGRIFVKGMGDTCNTGKCFTSNDNGCTWEEWDSPLVAVRNESKRSGWSGCYLTIGNKLYEFNSCYNGSYNELLCGIGMVTDCSIIVSGESYVLRNRNSSLCLDDAGGSTEAGNQMIQWYKNNLTTQAWKVDLMSDNTFRLTCLYSNLVLDNRGSSEAAGNPIQQYTDTGADSQRWIFESTGLETYQIKNVHSGLYLDVSQSSTSTNAAIVQENKSQSSSQQWMLERFEENGPGNGIYYIAASDNPNFVVDVTGNFTDNGTNIELWSKNETSAQKFRYTYVGDGMYAITGLGSGKALDVEGANANPGTNVQLYTYNGTAAQLWKLHENENGTYNIISACGNNYLDRYCNILEDGTNIQVWTKNGEEAQNWILIPQQIVNH